MLDRKITLAVYQRDNWKCRHCGDRNALHPHHINYKSHGGSDDLWNLLTLCAQCHRAHHDGFLKIAPVDWTIPATENQVRFVRLKGWKPS